MKFRQRRRGKQPLIRLAAMLGMLIAVAACRMDEGDAPTATISAPTPTAVSNIATAVPATSAPAEAADEVQPEPAPTATAEPQRPPKELVVCMAGEPADLYLYGVNMLVQRGVLHGIYENLYSNLGFEYQPRGLVKLPSLADGDATIETAVVSAGDRVLNSAGEVVFLVAGVEIVDHEGELVTFSDGTELMSQMQVDFQLQPLIWEDGTPVTADDSVYSYEIAADPETRIDRFRVEHTESYRAIDDLTLRWTGVPGYISHDYFLNVWQPLPQHVLGDYSAAELQSLDDALRRPLANGPFRLEEWIPGEHLTLARNEHYYLADEGFPLVDRVTFRFLVEPGRIVDGLLQGECDIAYQDGVGGDRLAELQEADDAGLTTLHVASTPIMEHLDFGVTPSTEYAANRPDWFGDAAVRQAIAQCIDRQALLDSIYAGFGEAMYAYVPAGHPLFPEDGIIREYDPGAANELLDAAGYTDRDGDGIREAPDVGVPFAVNLVTSSETVFRQGMADLIAAELLECGIQVTVETIPGEQLYANSPNSVLFGRRFDLALFSWLVHSEPACESYQSEQIPGPPPDFPAGWSGSNVTGWANEAFDQACAEALATLPGMEEHIAGHQSALRIFMEELPSLPLFLRIKLAATAPNVLNFDLDVTEPSELWNLYELDIAQD